jgi:hypothetical protein
MSIVLPPPPLQDAVIESARNPVLTKVWAVFFRGLSSRSEGAAVAVKAIAVAAQAAAIPTTDLIPLASGLYRVSYRFRVSTAAGVSSSLQLTVTTTEGGIPCTQSSAAYTGNATNAPQSGAFIVKADPSSPLAYSVAYASNPASAMQYELDIRVESL